MARADKIARQDHIIRAFTKITLGLLWLSQPNAVTTTQSIIPPPCVIALSQQWGGRWAAIRAWHVYRDTTTQHGPTHR